LCDCLGIFRVNFVCLSGIPQCYRNFML